MNTFKLGAKLIAILLAFSLVSCTNADDINIDDPEKDTIEEQIPLSGELEFNGKKFALKKLTKHDYLPLGYYGDECSIQDCIRKIVENDMRPYTNVSSLSYAYFNYVDAQEGGYGGFCHIKFDKGSWGFTSEGVLYFDWNVSGSKIQKGLNLVSGIFGNNDDSKYNCIEFILCDEDVISYDFYKKWSFDYPKSWPQHEWYFSHYFNGSIRVINLTDDSITLKFDNFSVGWPSHTDMYDLDGNITPITTPAVICLTINGQVTIPCVHYK